MKSIAGALRGLLIAFLLVAVTWVVLSNYSFVFSKTVKGEVVEVERVVQPTAIIGNGISPDQIFSFAVMIRSFDGAIYSASTEDRQWAVAKKGYCVEARFYPYPPWNLEKSGTYYNARMVRAFDCKREAPSDWSPISALSPQAPTNAGEASASANPTPVISPTPVAPPAQR